ncbi:MAG: hypothetical protein SGI89_00585 [bacterium]|nr:hypothetical protein [bacterium]
MYTHDIINLLKSFSDKELMRFFKFLKSPYFNNRSRLIKLFTVLRKFHPDYSVKNFTKKVIYKLVFGKAEYNDSTFRNLISDLLNSALQFLKQEGIQKSDVDSSFYLTQELFQRECFDLFRKRMALSKKILTTNSNINSNYFLNTYRIETDSFYVNLLTQKVLKKGIVITESEKLIKGIVHILHYFVLESIKHNDNLLQYSRSYNIPKNVETVSDFISIINFDKLISYIKNNSPEEVHIVEAYYNLLKAYTYFNDESYYFEFKNSLLNNTRQLGVNDNSFLHLRLIGYCILKITSGVQISFDVNKELFDLYRIYISNGFYKTDSSKYLPFDTYRNILLNCITMKELDYMGNFIKTHSKNLLPQHVESVENYSYALLFFEKKSFQKALNYINKIKFDQFVYKVDMKNLQLKISYELEEFETALSLIDAYKHFLKNNLLLSESRKILHTNFVNYTNKLIQLRTGSRKINLSFIEHKIQQSKNVFDKVWIQEKITEFNSVVKN